MQYLPSSWPKPKLTSWIGGGFIPPSSSGTVYKMTRSATNELLGTYDCATEEQVSRAIDEAQKAQLSWSRKTPIERGRILMETSRLLLKKKKMIAELETLITSRPIAETMVVDVQSAADCLEYFGGACASQQVGESHEFPNGAFVYTRREPLGVTAGVGAFNYPLQSAAFKAAPALAFGNSMVFKPAEDTPWTALILAETFKEAGLPDGLFSVVLGTGATTGNALVMDERISKISFTGSLATGSKIGMQAGKDLKKVTLELGGKSPLIIFDDASMEKAISGTMLANFYSNGEVCSNGTRVFVQEKIFDEFVNKLVKRTKQLRIGDPLDPSVDVGSLITEKHLQKVLGYVERAKKQGAVIHCGGERLTRPEDFWNQDNSKKLVNGAFISPAVITGVKDEDEIVKEEVFGPVATILKFKTEEEVIKRANDTIFGLAAGVFTNDLSRAHRVIHQLQAGQCWINHFNLAPVEIPWGGYKKSGTGRENGREAIHFWTQVKTIHVETSKDGLADPYPHAKI